MAKSGSTAADDTSRREKLRKIGLRDIPSDLQKLTLRDRETHVSRAQYKDHYYDIEVKSLDHLKQLVGNPDRSLETNGLREHLPFPMAAHEVPDGTVGDFSKYSRLQQAAVEQAARNIVYGHSKALALDEPRLNAVADWILKHGAVIPVFQAPDLEVMDGATVIFSDAAVLHFNRITVHGAGSVKCVRSAKVIADHIVAVP